MAKKKAAKATTRKRETRRAVDPPDSQPPTQPLVFISHDTRDAAIAEAFENLLIDSSAGVIECFRSSDRRGNSGIEFGEPWYDTIMEKLDQATDVVALLTKQSVDRPWILYETGVARGKLGRTVLGVTLGIPLQRAQGPFAHFQNASDDADDLTRLVMQLVTPASNPREEMVQQQVEKFKAQLNEMLARSGGSSEAEEEDTPLAKVYEELKLLRRESSAADNRLREQGWLTPGMDTSHLALTTQLLAEAEPIRTAVPWVYDLLLAYSLDPNETLEEALLESLATIGVRAMDQKTGSVYMRSRLRERVHTVVDLVKTIRFRRLQSERPRG